MFNRNTQDIKIPDSNRTQMRLKATMSDLKTILGRINSRLEAVEKVVQRLRT